MAGGAGGMAGAMGMANHANGGAVGMPAGAQPPPQGSHIPGGGGPGLPVSSAALGADLVDKHQQFLSQKQARNLAHLPIVAIDLYASEPHVAMFPPKAAEEGQPTGPPSLVGKMKSDVYFQGGSETAHKTLRKYLTKSKPFSALQADTLANADSKDAVKMERPQSWLGLRRTNDAANYLRSHLPKDVESSKGAFAEESSLDVGVTVSNSTLDGSEPLGDDFDRVVFQARVHPKKKALAVLPEEGVQILCHQAQYHVAKKVKTDKDDEEITEYPCAISVPAWQCHDAAIESLMDGMGGSGVLFQRSLCAIVGALRPGPQDKPNLLLEAINQVRSERMKAFQITKAKDPDATMVDEVTVFLFGTASDGVECTALQISSLQTDKMDCLFGDIKVLANVSYQAEDPSTVIEKSIQELSEIVTNSSSMSDLELPPAIAIYGSAQQQAAIKQKWDAMKAKKVPDWKDIPLVITKSDCVAIGTAVLGAVSHGRLRTITQVQGKKPKAILAIRVADVAPVAVGVRMNYHGDAKKEWTDVKTIFDFDRRVPAGPYAIDLKASECAVHREHGSDLSDEDFLKFAKANEGSGPIPKREEAARNLRVQIFQKWTRDGEWKKVGDVKKALIVIGKDEEEIACEHAVLELSLGPTGIITAGLHGEGESVVQATVTARNSFLRYWIGLFLAVAFFGGFLIKSYWEERVFDRDTNRLLAYYKFTVPGSFQDGDNHNARYLVWKYRKNKEKLWRVLEKKYGEPVLQAHEYPDVVEEEPSEDGEEQNLDDEESSKDEQEQQQQQDDEPDL